MCASQPGQGAVIRCLWVDEVTAGVVVFIGKSATSFADDAAKTRQIRAAIEH